MARDYLSGIMLGAIIGGVGIGATSLLTDLPPETAGVPQTGEVEVPGGSEFDQAKPDETPVLPGTERAGGPRQAAALSAPPSRTGSLTEPQTEPGIVPSTSEADIALRAPETEVARPEIALGTDIDIDLTAQAVISAPNSAVAPAIDTVPAPKPEPVVEAVEPPQEEEEPAPVIEVESPDIEVALLEPVVPERPETPEVTTPPLAVEEAPTPEVTVAPEPEGEPDVTVDAPQAPEVEEPVEEAAAVPQESETPQQPTAPETDTTAEPESGADEAPEIAEPDTPESDPEVIPDEEAEDPTEPGESEAEAPVAEAETPATPAAPEAEETAPRIGVPVGEITNRAPNVTINRLPRIGGEASEEAEEAEIAQLPAATALERNRVSFDNPEAKPLFSIVLIDDGSAGDDIRAAARALPFPVSFAVSVADPEAGARAASYRAAGFEVLMMLSLPQGAQPSDIEVAFQSAAGAVPDAVAILDAEQDGFAANRVAASQIAEILAESGHGLLVHNRGLNAARQVAERHGVANALIFRTVDQDNDSSQRIRRYMDRAAFRAQQEGQVVLLGHLYSETVSALAEWAVEDRASSLAVAPISSVLTGG